MHLPGQIKRRRRLLLLSLLLAPLLTFLVLRPGGGPEVQEQDLDLIDLFIGPPAPVMTQVRKSLLIPPGRVIINLLQEHGVEPDCARRLVRDSSRAHDLARIKAGHEIILLFSGNRLENFRYQISRESYLEARRNGDGFVAALRSIPHRLSRERIELNISYSLFDAVIEAGELPELAETVAKLYEYDIDFNRDIRPGDQVALLLDKKYFDGRPAGYESILASEFISRGRVLTLVGYTTADGKFGYYHPDGRAVQKMFLRCPLPFMRVTSRFGNRRHPVLGFSAQHNGVDFGAPSGTPIRSTASGVVQQAGTDRSRGRFIIIRHPNRYHSHYYHLSRFAPGLRSGQRVSQGQLIGYVGSTGLSTGPHLHYGLQHNGRFINPLSFQPPSRDPIKKDELPAFKEFVREISAALNQGAPDFMGPLPLSPFLPSLPGGVIR